MHNPGHNILRHFDVLPNFLFQQVKRIVIISNKHGIYELPRELQNDTGNIKKISKFHKIIA